MLLQRIDKDKKNPIQLSIMGTKTSKHTPKVASVNKNLVLPLKNFKRPPAWYDEVLLFWILLLVPLPGVEAVGGLFLLASGLLEVDVEAVAALLDAVIFGDILSKGSVFTSISGGEIGGVDDKRSSLDSVALFLPLLRIWDLWDASIKRQ